MKHVKEKYKNLVFLQVKYTYTFFFKTNSRKVLVLLNFIILSNGNILFSDSFTELIILDLNV